MSNELDQLSGSPGHYEADVTDQQFSVVLIDEIENAGINRLQALEILTGQGKIVLVVSHDPTLILLPGKGIDEKWGMYKILRLHRRKRDTEGFN